MHDGKLSCSRALQVSQNMTELGGGNCSRDWDSLLMPVEITDAPSVGHSGGWIHACITQHPALDTRLRCVHALPRYCVRRPHQVAAKAKLALAYSLGRYACIGLHKAPGGPLSPTHPFTMHASVFLLVSHCDSAPASPRWHDS